MSHLTSSLILLALVEFVSVADLCAFQFLPPRSAVDNPILVDMQLGDLSVPTQQRDSFVERLARRRRHARRRSLAEPEEDGEAELEEDGEMPAAAGSMAPPPRKWRRRKKMAKLRRRWRRQSQRRFHAKHGKDGRMPNVSYVHEMPKRRIFLMALSHCFHGSTALEGLLMSSKNLATLCSSGVPNCEGGAIMMRHAEQTLVSGDKTMTASDRVAVVDGHEMYISEELWQERMATHWNYSEALDQFSRYWDLDRPVLFDKTPNVLRDLATVYKGFKQAALPEAFRIRGVSSLEYAFVLMWRPSCLWKLSSHARKNVTQHGIHDYALSELQNIQGVLDAHDFLAASNVQTLVVSLGDLVWHSEDTALRLLKFLPILGSLDANYVPTRHRDLTAGNNWKADGSVLEFGEMVPAHVFGYNAEAGECSPDSSLYDVLTPSDKLRAKAIELRLRSLSS